MFCLSNCCRLCLCKNSTVKEYTSCSEDNTSFFDKLMDIVPQVLEDTAVYYPTGICKTCQEKLNEAYSFFQQCFRSKTILHKYITKLNKLNNINSEEYVLTDTQLSSGSNSTHIENVFIETDVKIEETNLCLEYTSDQTQSDPLITTEFISFNECIKTEVMEINNLENDLENTDKHSTEVDAKNMFVLPADTENCVNNINCAPLEIREAAKDLPLDLLPKISRKNYKIVYNTFNKWQLVNNTTSFSEDTLLVYFKKMAEKYKSSTLWSHYSMLKSILNVKHNVNIESYARLRALLRIQSEGYQPKKSEAFTDDEINRFINEAPDTKYLATKVALIMRVIGACRAKELYAMKNDDLKYFEGCIQVLVPQTRTKVHRQFLITDSFYNIVKKYVDLHPDNTPSNSFFLNFQNGKCTNQIIGINKFGAMGKEVAKFLGLQNPERYTGHCLRRSSATLCDGGLRTKALKSRYGGSKSASVVDKVDNIRKITSKINSNSVNNLCESNSCTSSSAANSSASS